MRLITIISLFLSIYSYSQLTTKVFDIGPGLCTITKLPDGKVFLYDCGTQENGYKFKEPKQEAVNKFIPKGSTIDLVIISHTDSDHMSGMAYILKNYDVKKVIWTSYSKKNFFHANGEDKKDHSAYREFEKQLKLEKDVEVIDLNESDSIIQPFSLLKIGGAKLWLMTGFGNPPKDWKFKSNRSKSLNSISITCILEYKKKKIYFGGDAVGNKKEETITIASDKYLLDKVKGKKRKRLDCDVVIASHHGSSNGTGEELAGYLKGEYIIYSAGSEYGHPYDKTKKRFFDARDKDSEVEFIQYPTNKLDNSKKLDKYNCHKVYQDDRSLDDNVIIHITKKGILSVNYE